MRSFLKLCGLLVLLMLLASYGGRFHPLGDSLAVFRPAMALVLLALAFAFRGVGRLGLLAVVLVAGLPIIWMMRPGPVTERVVIVYQKNLLFNRGDSSGLIADFRETRADVLLLEEVSAANLPILEAMRDSHPYQVLCPAHSVGGVAILSAYRISDAYCAEGQGYATARVHHMAGEFTAVAIHLHWPWPFGQEAQVNRILGNLAGLRRPLVMGGDFNMVPWSGAPRRVAQATDTRILGPMRPTLFVKGYPLPIDHVLVDFRTRGEVELRPKLGSDHHGVLARIGARGGA